MPIVVNHPDSIVEITSPTTEMDMQTLADFLEDDLATPYGMCHGSIILPEGKIEDPSNPGVYSQIIVILDSAWQIQFWSGSGYTRLYGGKLVGGVGNEPMKATGTAGDITVLESPVDGVTVVSGSGLSTEEHNQLMDLDTNYLKNIIDGKKVLVKNGLTWELVIYDPADGITPILNKEMKDKDGNEISDLTAGILAQELANTA